MTVCESSTPQELAEVFTRGVPPGLPDQWWNDSACIEAHRMILQAALADARLRQPLAHDGGRGIVICGGGERLFTNAYVCIRMLRYLGCNLPIELWCLGRGEIDVVMRDAVARHAVTVMDAERIAGMAAEKPRILNGWELKSFALLYSVFRDVLMLDSDNVPVRNPEYLFEVNEYRDCGAIMWPDYSRLGRDRAIWDICGVPYRDEPEVESGQLVVNREMCHAELRVAWAMNNHSDFFYKHIHGDKETFHMAWRMTGREYAMPSRRIVNLDNAVMCQHDMDGLRVFQHRNLDKWQYANHNRPIPGFEHEPMCRQFIAELRDCWSGEVWAAQSASESENAAAREVSEWLVQEEWTYQRVGYDSRPMNFKADGHIGRGAARCERFWRIVSIDGELTLVISSGSTVTALLSMSGTGWSGAWVICEKMPVNITLKAQAGGSTWQAKTSLSASRPITDTTC